MLSKEPELPVAPVADWSLLVGTPWVTTETTWPWPFLVVTVSVPLAFCTTLVVVALLDPEPPPEPEAAVDDPVEVEAVDDVDEVEFASVELLLPDADVEAAVRLVAAVLPIALIALNFDLRCFPSPRYMERASPSQLGGENAPTTPRRGETGA